MLCYYAAVVIPPAQVHRMHVLTTCCREREAAEAAEHGRGEAASAAAARADAARAQVPGCLQHTLLCAKPSMAF